MHEIDDVRFQAAVTEIQLVLVRKMRFWHIEDRVAFLGEFLDFRAAGIWQTEHSCHLVEGFSARVVSALSDKLKMLIVKHLDDCGVSAACEQAKIRRFERGIDIVCGDMSFDVRNGKQRLAPRIRERFCKVDAHKQRSEQPRAVGDGNGVDVVLGHICLFKRFFDDVFDCERVISACNLGHYAAETSVDLDLRCHNVGHDFPAVSHDCTSGLVTARFDGKHRQIFFVLQTIHSLFTPVLPYF